MEPRYWNAFAGCAGCRCGTVTSTAEHAVDYWIASLPIRERAAMADHEVGVSMPRGVDVDGEGIDAPDVARGEAGRGWRWSKGNVRAKQVPHEPLACLSPTGE